ncbi:LuxR family transcriptional regulator (plasmid) [Cupriavidus necator]|uniref:LuxR family transcriptional regulator n=1 Tax=Cupriavidus necator TaxID=106590 RepID=A0A367PA86_CUPNE|nr:helix-turn-helix transcriptional regulator [Cupriavidus necator]QQX89149.1 LuxR family transcriptional regulator [Cupriavidus necator]RCJ04137.1 LuxR family transcriptional regulator [Cupriavidus necator]
MTHPPWIDVQHPGQSALGVDEISDLIGLVYDGPLLDIPWQSLLDALRHLLAANYVTLVLRPPSNTSPGLMITSSAVDTTVGTGAYAQHFYAIDPFVNLPNEQVLTAYELIGETKWLESEIYRFFNKPYDVLHIMGVDIRPEQGVECRLRVCRPHGSDKFSNADKALCQRIVPHLQRAVRIHANLDTTESERRLYAGTVDRLLIGSVILDDTGQILTTNGMADALLAERDGLMACNGQLMVDSAQENRKLQALIRQAMTLRDSVQPGIPIGLSVSRRGGHARLGLLVRPVAAPKWAQRPRQPAVAVFIRDPDQKAPASADLLRDMYEFTRAEASLVLLLTQGLSLDEAAQELDIRRNTARAHLRAVFSKTGVTRQAALVQTVLQSIIPLG